MMVAVAVLQLGHEAWFVRSNPPPQFSELQIQTIQVLGWQPSHPQLHVRLQNGQNRMMEFPTLSLSRDLYWGISREQQEQLVGKSCKVSGRQLRASLQDSYQVFALDCEDGLGLAYSKAISLYVAHFNSRKNPSISLFILIYGLCFTLTFWAETVRYRKSLQKAKP